MWTEIHPFVAEQRQEPVVPPAGAGEKRSGMFPT